MATPLGEIKFSDLNTELGTTGQINLNRADVRNLAGVASGEIAMSNLQGKASLIVAEFDITYTFDKILGYGWDGTTNICNPLKISVDGQNYYPHFSGQGDSFQMHFFVDDADENGKGYAIYDRLYFNGVLNSNGVDRSALYRNTNNNGNATGSEHQFFTKPWSQYPTGDQPVTITCRVEWDSLNYQPYPTQAPPA